MAPETSYGGDIAPAGEAPLSDYDAGAPADYDNGALDVYAGGAPTDGLGGANGLGDDPSLLGGDQNLAMLEKAVPGIPGEDYPIYASVPETAFVCDGQVEGGKEYMKPFQKSRKMK